MSLKVETEYEDTGWSGRTRMTISHKGEVIEERYDGGEPEDQSFDRDWSWVEGAILKAYDLGVQDGKESVSSGLLGHGRLPRSAED